MAIHAAPISALGTADVVIAPLYEDAAFPAALPRAYRAAYRRISAERGASRPYCVHTHLAGRDKRLVVVGAGKRQPFDVERLRRVGSAGVRALWQSDVRRVGVLVDVGRDNAARAAQAVVEGVEYAMWRPELYRTDPDGRRLPPIVEVLVVAETDVAAAVERGRTIGRAVNVARTLAVEPANRLTPTVLAERAQAIASDAGIRCDVLDRRRCAALGMHSFLAVAQGSHQPPRFIVLRYQGRPGRGYDLALVGKGITFDAGGLSLKPLEGMFRMKADMTGAAVVIAAMAAFGRLRPRVNVIAAAPCAENLPGGGALKPGDVISSMSGRSIEVTNTDAEGRLVLVDALTYVQRQGAKQVVDVATLTGAIVVALGHHYSGLFGRPGPFVDEVRSIGEQVGERFWPMPLSDEYREALRSDIADLVNYPYSGRDGSAIKAAAFLDAAIEPDTRWAHLDIAGTDWSDEDRPYTPKGPQAPGVRTLIALAERLAL